MLNPSNPPPSCPAVNEYGSFRECCEKGFRKVGAGLAIIGNGVTNLNCYAADPATQASITSSYYNGGSSSYSQGNIYSASTSSSSSTGAPDAIDGAAATFAAALTIAARTGDTSMVATAIKNLAASAGNGGSKPAVAQQLQMTDPAAAAFAVALTNAARNGDNAGVSSSIRVLSQQYVDRGLVSKADVEAAIAAVAASAIKSKAAAAASGSAGSVLSGLGSGSSDSLRAAATAVGSAVKVPAPQVQQAVQQVVQKAAPSLSSVLGTGPVKTSTGNSSTSSSNAVAQKAVRTTAAKAPPPRRSPPPKRQYRWVEPQLEQRRLGLCACHLYAAHSTSRHHGWSQLWQHHALGLQLVHAE
jgi:hypothetical protein